jgi:GNAT superfamily N-acetyltransferase
MATIRKAVIGDEEALAKLNGFVQDLHLQHRPDDFKQTHVSELAAFYKSLFEEPTAHLWIAEAEGEPAGYVLAMFRHSSEDPFALARDWCEIDQIAVDPNYRRKGIARLLVLSALAAARARGIRRIEAACWSFNREAHEVFRRLGFAPKGVRFERECLD